MEQNILTVNLVENKIKARVTELTEMINTINGKLNELIVDEKFDSTNVQARRSKLIYSKNQLESLLNINMQFLMAHSYFSNHLQ